MAYFDCIVGGSGKGNTLVVTCADDLAGATITCTNGTKTYTKTCPSTAPYEVTFYGLVAGTWTVSATVSGNTYTTTVVVVDCAALLGGFSWRTWVDTAKFLDSSDYNSLDEVLADEEAVRELCLEHACVDYLAAVPSVNEDIETVINNDLFAKWVNNSDYSLDILGTNVAIKALMDTADKYGYGEWIITDATTTPKTWGPKGNVPVMTSNTAPYGEVSSNNSYSTTPPYLVFDGDDVSFWQGNSYSLPIYISYKSTNPFKAKRGKILDAQYKRIRTFKIQASNDNFVNEVDDVTDTISLDGSGNEVEFDINDTKYYLYHRIAILSATQTPSLNTLQFYGRELSVSVPKMTTNTTPYGEVKYSSAQNNSSDILTFGAFDNNASTAWACASNDNDRWCGYDFGKKVKIKAIYQSSRSAYPVTTYKIQASNTGGADDWSDITESLSNKFESINPTDAYRYWRLKCLTGGSGNIFTLDTLQFYGLDYSEKEFEEGATKKWLYDHGVELESMDLTGYSEYHAAVVDVDGIKNSDNIELSIPAGDYKCLIGTQEKVDFTPYTYLMGKYRFKSIKGNAQLKVVGVKQDNNSASSTISFSELYASSNAQTAVDVSSINALDYPIFRTYGYTPGVGNLAQDFEAYELWLE